MSKSKRKHVGSSLQILAAAMSAVPLLAPAASAQSPSEIATATMPAGTALQTIAQSVARGEDMISPQRLQDLVLAKRHDYTLIDVRTPDAFAAAHIDGAVNTPLPKLLANDEVVRLRRMPQVIVYADNTGQAAQAAVMLRMSGVPALALAGGLEAWAKRLEKQAKEPQSAAIVRALNACPAPAQAAIPPLNTAPPSAGNAPAAVAPSEGAPTTPKKAAPVILNGMCG